MKFLEHFRQTNAPLIYVSYDAQDWKYNIAFIYLFSELFLNLYSIVYINQSIINKLLYVIEIKTILCIRR